MSDPLSTQVGGSHYKEDKIQHAEFCHANDLPYILGNTLKYVMRHRKKNGLQDLEKAHHYLRILMELQSRMPSKRTIYVGDYVIHPTTMIAANNIPLEEAAIITSCWRYHLTSDQLWLSEALNRLEHLMHFAYGKE